LYFEISREDLKGAFVEEARIYTEIADIVYKNCGIVFKESNLTVLKSRLSAKLKEKNTTIDKYFEILKSDSKELASFIDFVTTNFTSFFRHEDQFEILEHNILPTLIESNKNEKRIKIWSAGCSTGEEPYSIAMVVDKFFEKNGMYNHGWDFSMIASDISLESLFIAREAKYNEKSVSKVKKDFLDKYFYLIENNVFIVKDFLRKKIKFDLHNLIYDNGIRNVDVIFCRNVIIYFDEDVQKKVLDNFYVSAKNGAFLILGHSESLFEIYDKFKPISFEKGVIYVKS